MKFSENSLSPAKKPDSNEADFAKNFQRILGMAEKELGGLTPVQEQKARKIFNETVQAGLAPTDPDKTENIYNKIIAGLMEGNSPISDARIFPSDSKEKNDGSDTSSIGRLYSRQ